MSSALDKLFNKQKERFALNLIKLGQLSLETIAASMELSLDRVKQLAAYAEVIGD